MDAEQSPESDKDLCALSKEKEVLPSTSMDDASTKSTSKETKFMETPPDSGTQSTDTFKVDTSLIPKASLEDQNNDELLALGLTVFNQEEFEQSK